MSDFRIASGSALGWGPSAQRLRFLVPKTILLMAFGTRKLEHWELGTLGESSFYTKLYGHPILTRYLLRPAVLRKPKELRRVPCLSYNEKP